MAESLLKLRVESSEYDTKLANAAKGIRHLADVAHQSNGDLTGLEKSELDYIRALGEMETKSRSASGQVRELTSTYKELKVIYDQLNEVEKADEGGKALAASLETLKQRAQEAKAQLDSASQSLQSNEEAGKSTSSIMQMLKDKFTINIDAIKLFNIGLQAAEGVLNVVKGAIASTETTYDALARATAVTDSVTNQFLVSLANADFSSFINGLQGIIDKAIEAYNVMDEFESYAARFNPKQQAQEAEIQTKLMEARAAKAKGDKERAEQLTKEAQNLIEELSQTTKAYGEKQTAGGYAVIRSLMGTVDVTDQEIAWYADPKHWEEVKEAAESYRKKQEEIKKLSQGNITAVSYDQQSRTENIRRQREIEASITARERQAYTFQNLRDSGNSEEAQAFQRALGNIYGTVLADARVSSLKARADRMEGVLEGGGRTGGTTRTGTKITPEEILPEGSVSALTKQMQDLQKEQQLVTSYAGWQEYQQKIESVSDRISILKGELPKNKEAVFTITAETSEALDKLRDIEGVTIDPKTLTVTAETQEAIAALQRVDGLTIQPKTAEVTFKADDADLLAKVRDVDGVTIDPKTLTVTAETQEAIAALQRVDGLTIQPKTAEVTFKADDADLLAKVRDVDGVTIDPKTLTVTAETQEAIAALQRVDGLTIQPKTAEVTFKADDADLLAKVRDVDGVTIDPKTLTVTAETQEAIAALQRVDGLTIQPKTAEVTFKADDADLLAKVRDVDGVTIDPKTLTVTAETQEAIAALQRVDGLTIQPKTAEVTFKADDADLLAKVRDVDGVTIDPKTLTVTAETQEAIAALQRVDGLTIQPKTTEVTVTAETSEALRSVQELIGGLEGTTIQLKVKAEPQEMAIGTSIQNSAGLSEYISDLQKQLSTADFATPLYNNLQAQLADTTTLQNLVGEALKVGLGTALFDVADETGADFWTRAMEGGVKNIDWQTIIDQINEARKAAGLDAISLDFKTGSVSTDGKKNPYLNRNDEGKMELKMTDALGGMASGIQNMAGGLEQLGIDIPQGLSDVVSGIQSVTNILSAIMSIVSVIQAIAGADAIIPFAGGGIVPHFAGGGLIGKAALGITIPGHSYSGDLLRLPVDGGRGMIGVNSGEIVMNQAQAGILESELSGGRMRDINVHGVLQGENIVLAVSNYFRRTGKGEAAMWGKN